jgi:hypothetical protein
MVIVAVGLARQQLVACPPVAELLFNGATALKQAATNRHCGDRLMQIASGLANLGSALQKRCDIF